MPSEPKIKRGNLEPEYAKVKRSHPTLSDVALALAQRRSDPITKVSLSLNAKGDVQIEVDVNDTDPKVAQDTADTIFAALRQKYPRQNGETK